MSGSPLEIRRDGTQRALTRAWVPEAPVALEFNGLAYAVMMASPLELEDFATGFALTEGLAAVPGEVRCAPPWPGWGLPS
jgi:FdhD protein